MNIWVPESSEISINELKSKYNETLKRHNKAASYLDNPEISIEKREKYILAYLKILKRLNDILKQFDNAGVEYTEIEGLEGFFN